MRCPVCGQEPEDQVKTAFDADLLSKGFFPVTMKGLLKDAGSRNRVEMATRFMEIMLRVPHPGLDYADRADGAVLCADLLIEALEEREEDALGK